jgi:hypothetical protein
LQKILERGWIKMNERLARIEKFLEQIQVNEPIKRLAEQAGCTIDRLGYGEGNIEKFAELIVRECSDVCERIYSRNYKDMSEGSIASMECCDAILEHFGVE